MHQESRLPKKHPVEHFVLCSVCDHGTWNCGDQDCKASVICPHNLQYSDSFQRCGTTCSTYHKLSECDKSEAFVDGCTCFNNTVLDHAVSNGYFLYPIKSKPFQMFFKIKILIKMELGTLYIVRKFFLNRE